MVLSPLQAVAPFPARKGAPALTQKEPIRWRLLAALASPQLLKVTVLLLCASRALGADHGQPPLSPLLQHLGEVTPRSHDLGGRENDEASHVESFHHQERKQ